MQTITVKDGQVFDIIAKRIKTKQDIREVIRQCQLVESQMAENETTFEIADEQLNSTENGMAYYGDNVVLKCVISLPKRD